MRKKSTLSVHCNLVHCCASGVHYKCSTLVVECTLIWKLIVVFTTCISSILVVVWIKMLTNNSVHYKYSTLCDKYCKLYWLLTGCPRYCTFSSSVHYVVCTSSNVQ